MAPPLTPPKDLDFKGNQRRKPTTSKTFLSFIGITRNSD